MEAPGRGQDEEDRRAVDEDAGADPSSAHDVTYTRQGGNGKEGGGGVRGVLEKQGGGASTLLTLLRTRMGKA